MMTDKKDPLHDLRAAVNSLTKEELLQHERVGEILTRIINVTGIVSIFFALDMFTAGSWIVPVLSAFVVRYLAKVGTDIDNSLRIIKSRLERLSKIDK